MLERSNSIKDSLNKVILEWSQRIIERGRKAFHFYMQSLDGKTPIWNAIISKLMPYRIKQITGVIFSDNSVVWSDEAVVHDDLVIAAKKIKKLWDNFKA